MHNWRGLHASCVYYPNKTKRSIWVNYGLILVIEFGSFLLIASTADQSLIISRLVSL